MPPAAAKSLAELLGQERVFKWQQQIDQQIISAMGLPIPIIERFESCDTPPHLNELDPYREDGQISMKIYTDPDFALVQWLNEQRELQAKHPGGESRSERFVRGR